MQLQVIRPPTPLLAPQFVEEKRDVCRACDHAVDSGFVRGPGKGRKFWCGLLRTPTDTRASVCYLPNLTELLASPCPLKRHREPKPSDLRRRGDAAITREKASLRKREAFHALWRELHTVEAPTVEWWADFVKRTPCGFCRRHAKAYAAKFPPPFGDRLRFRVWGHAFHNYVNRNKRTPSPTLNYGEAAKLYGWA